MFIDNIVIMAGGESNRFWPLGDKNTIFIGATSLIQKQVRTYSEFTDNLIVVTNAGNYDLILDHIKKIKKNNVKITIQDKHGQSEAILAAAKLGIREKTLIVNNNDIVDAKNVIQNLLKVKSCELVITSFKPKDYFPGGYLKIKNDLVIEVIEKPDPEKTPSPYVKIDLNYFHSIQNFLEILRKTKSEKDDVFEVATTDFSKKYNTKFIVYEGEWITLKYPWHLLDFMKKELDVLKKNIGRNSIISKSAVINGQVFLGENVIIHEYAKINGPCYIGNNTIIGNYALVTESNIGENSVIGAYSEVTRSYIGDHVFLHRNYIGDSIIMNDVLFGAGALTANMRLDNKFVRSIIKQIKIDTKRQKLGAMVGKHAKIGVNASLMPGIKIGPSKLIKPGEVVYEDIN